MAFLAAADPPQETTPMANTSRRDFIGLLGGAATWPTWAQGETRGKDPTIGVLWHAGDAEEEKFPLSLFRQGLQDVGYVEGQNITVHLAV
jgi:putative tryptophan/tyrosine transport system substrate-binding protein